jgi:hypothetical protein
MNNYNNKVAVVTGANKGIGYAIVKELSKKFNGLVYLTGIFVIFSISKFKLLLICFKKKPETKNSE